MLFLTHYLPDDPGSNQDMSIGSLVLGQNGIWGDLLAISSDGVARMARLLAAYKQVREDITAASVIRTGVPGGMVESYEKIDASTGRGVLVVFANRVGSPFGPDRPMTTQVVTEAVVDQNVVTTAGAAMRFDAEGRAVVDAQFAETGAVIVFFGATE